MLRFACIAALVAVMTVGLLGCGGDDQQVPVEPGPPAPHPDNAVVEGRVLAADNVELRLGRAVVSEPTTGRSTETDSTGAFRLTGLPAGAATRIQVQCPRTPDYDSASLTVPTVAGGTTTVNIAVLPVRAGIPTGLNINPAAPPVPDVELGGTVNFEAAVHVGAERVTVQPTWILTDGNVGTIDARGRFTATSAGTATVRATVGGLTASTGILVTGPRAPRITSVLVTASTDDPLPASGGPVTITAAISDANGVRRYDDGPAKGLKFEIYTPAGAVLELTPGEPLPGTTIFDGTWRLTYTVPANSNRPGADGVQAPQTYLVRVAARDLTGREAFSAFHEFTVMGLDPPPPPPAG